jgi:hypothetical protein
MADENERRRIGTLPLQELQRIAKPGTFEFVRADAPINRGMRASSSSRTFPNPFFRQATQTRSEEASEYDAREAKSRCCREPRPRYYAVAESGSAPGDVVSHSQGCMAVHIGCRAALN